METENRVQYLRITNSKSTALRLHLEPWGEQFVMDPGTTFQIVATGPEGDCMELEYDDEHITLWGWSGSVISIFHKGQRLGGGDIPMPDLPSGA